MYLRPHPRPRHPVPPPAVENVLVLRKAVGHDSRLTAWMAGKNRLYVSSRRVIEHLRLAQHLVPEVFAEEPGRVEVYLTAEHCG